MLRYISIQNFKGVGERVELELHPVTLLFGPNSVGKSTILHAMHYAHAVLETGHAEVGRTRLGGDVDLGGFASFVHNHDLSSEVKLGFGVDVRFSDIGTFLQQGGWDLDRYVRHADDEDAPEYDASVSAVKSFLEDVHSNDRPIFQANAEMDVGWSHVLGKAVVVRFKLCLYGNVLVEIIHSRDGTNTWLRNYKRDKDDASEAQDELLACYCGTSGALPRDELYIENVEAVGGEPAARDLRQQVCGFIQILKAELERLLYLGPFRAVVPRNFQQPRNSLQSRWANGLGAWDTLASNELLRKQTNHWLNSEEHLDTGYRVETRGYRELDDESYTRMLVAAANGSLNDAFEPFASRLTRKHRLVLFDEPNGLDLAPCDLGEGIGQVIPVIAASFAESVTTPDGSTHKPALVVVEQPELHIHPRMQVVLGDLFLSQCHDRQFLVETHSEHLMLRLLRRIRETTEGELPPNAPEAKVDDVAVYYVESTPTGAKLKELTISADGEFEDDWPGGFFDERADEVF